MLIIELSGLCVSLLSRLYYFVAFVVFFFLFMCFFFQAEGGLRFLVRSRGLGDVYKRQHNDRLVERISRSGLPAEMELKEKSVVEFTAPNGGCPLYTSEAAHERSRGDLGGRRNIKKKKNKSNEDLGKVMQKKHIITLNRII